MIRDHKQAYYAGEITAEEIANIEGVNRRSVVGKLGTPDVFRVRELDLSEYYSDYRKRKITALEIAKLVGYSKHTVSTILSKNGVRQAEVSEKLHAILDLAPYYSDRYLNPSEISEITGASKTYVSQVLSEHKFYRKRIDSLLEETTIADLARRLGRKESNIIRSIR